MSPLLKPGDYVTVTATFKSGNGSTQQTVAYQNVKVLATDATLQSSDGSSQSAGYSTVTLELTPEQLSEIGTADSISLAAQPLSENPRTIPTPMPSMRRAMAIPAPRLSWTQMIPRLRSKHAR